MTEKEAVEALDAITGGDAENGHGDADDVILSFLGEHFPEIKAAWDRVQERYGGFWYA